MQACQTDGRNFGPAWNLLLVIGLGAALCGCSSDRLPVAAAEGEVTYNGKPLAFGTVVFEPKQGPPASAVIQSDGSFVLSTYGSSDGAIIGSHKVMIGCNENQKPGYTPPAGEEPAGGKSLIPEKYGLTTTSGLTAEVTAGGDNNFAFDLKD